MEILKTVKLGSEDVQVSLEMIENGWYKTNTLIIRLVKDKRNETLKGRADVVVISQTDCGSVKTTEKDLDSIDALAVASMAYAYHGKVVASAVTKAPEKEEPMEKPEEA